MDRILSQGTVENNIGLDCIIVGLKALKFQLQTLQDLFSGSPNCRLHCDGLCLFWTKASPHTPLKSCIWHSNSRNNFWRLWFLNSIEPTLKPSPSWEYQALFHSLHPWQDGWCLDKHCITKLQCFPTNIFLDHWNSPPSLPLSFF